MALRHARLILGLLLVAAVVPACSSESGGTPSPQPRVEATAKPIVVPVPDSAGPIEQAESISMLIKRALGIDLSKKK